MKINQNQLTNYLNNLNNINNFFWLNGEDNFLLQQATKQIRSAAKINGYNERTIIHIDNNTNWHDIINIISTPDLFNDKQLIEINFINKLSVTEQQELINIAKLVTKYNTICLVVYPFRLDSKTLQQRWMMDLEKIGVIITIWPLSDAEYQSWLKKQCQKYKINFEGGATFDYFCQKTSCNPGAASQILYKLRLQEITTVNQEILTNIISEHANYDVFDLVDNYLIRNIKKCFTILNTLKKSDTEPLLITWVLKKELHTLAEIQEIAYRTKEPPNQILQKYHFWQNKKNIIATALNKFALSLIYQALDKISSIEILIKTENNHVFIWQQINELLLINLVEFPKEL